MVLGEYNHELQTLSCNSPSAAADATTSANVSVGAGYVVKTIVSVLISRQGLFQPMKRTALLRRTSLLDLTMRM